jgi:hypothetical protein
MVAWHTVDMYEPICDQIAQLVAEKSGDIFRPQLFPERIFKS